MGGRGVGETSRPARSRDSEVSEGGLDQHYQPCLGILEPIYHLLYLPTSPDLRMEPLTTSSKFSLRPAPTEDITATSAENLFAVSLIGCRRES